MQIYVPTTIAEDWKRLLAKQHHWKQGRSAMAMALCWEANCWLRNQGQADSLAIASVRYILRGLMRTGLVTSSSRRASSFGPRSRTLVSPASTFGLYRPRRTEEPCLQLAERVIHALLGLEPAGVRTSWS
jgi:hypothetical protein